MKLLTTLLKIKIMDKTKAIKRVAAIEKELEELKKIIDAPDYSNPFECKSYSDVCKSLKITELTESNFGSRKEFRFHQIQNIQKLFNGDWVPGPGKNNFYPYFEWKKVGLVVDGSIFDYCYFFGPVAYFKDRESSDYVGKTFKYIYEELT